MTSRRQLERGTTHRERSLGGHGQRRRRAGSSPAHADTSGRVRRMITRDRGRPKNSPRSADFCSPARRTKPPHWRTSISWVTLRVQAAFQPLGVLRLDFGLPGRTEDYRRELICRRGIATVRFRAVSTVFTRECFISHPDGVLVMRITASEPAKSASPPGWTRFIPTRFARVSRTVSCSKANGTRRQAQGLDCKWSVPGMRYAIALQAELEGGSLEAGTNTLKILGANAVTLCLAAGTSFATTATSRAIPIPSGGSIESCREAEL